MRLFREHGYDGTSMQDLAEALGMHRGSLYHYIDSKEDLLFEIVESAMARFHDEVRPILQGQGAAGDRLRRAVAAHLRIAADEPDELALLQVEVKALAPARRARIVAERDAYEHAWRAFIREGMREGSFRCEDERTAGFMILAACNWFSQWYHPAGPLGVDDFAARFTALFLDALRAEPGSMLGVGSGALAARVARTAAPLTPVAAPLAPTTVATAPVVPVDAVPIAAGQTPSPARSGDAGLPADGLSARPQEAQEP